MMNEQMNNNVNDLNSAVQTQYVDEFGNPIDPSLIDEFGNYIGESVTQYVDEFGNPIDPSLIDEFGNYIGESVQTNPIESLSNTLQNNTVSEENIAQELNNVSGNIDLTSTAEIIENKEEKENTTISGGSQHQMDDKEFMQGMVTFDYNNVPITDIVNSIILDAINKGASDIHFDPFDEGIKIRIRIDGQLNDYSIVPLYVKKNMITRIKIISGMNITESRTPQDGAIRTELQNKTIDLRVSCLPTNMGEKIVVRIMDYSMSSAGLEALDFEPDNLEKVNKMISLPNGIILVTGATGSGKSTTVYSMLQKLNVEGTNLITVEDPIEMNIGGINQVQAQAEIGLTFASVLRSILRQDPDVIMIGEIRDDETARIAVRASITGHLVLSTIHTNNSLNTIERLTDMSVERYLLGSSLAGIISQKLSRRLCDHCKKLRPTTEYEKKVFMESLGKEVDEIYEPVGCPKCSRGYRGRIAIHEVLLVNQAIRDAITKNVTKAELRSLVYGVGGTTTMLQDGLTKVLEGNTSFEEIIKLIDLEDDLGTGTQLGLDQQLQESQMSNNGPAIPTNITTSSPINFNLSDELLSGIKELISSLKNNNDNTTKVVEQTEKVGKEQAIEEVAPPTPSEIIENIEDEIPSDIIEEFDEIEVFEEPINENNDTAITKEEVIERLPDDKDIDNIQDLLNKIRINFNAITSAEKQLNKKELNLKVQELITATIPLVRDLTRIDDEVRFSDERELEIKELVNEIGDHLSSLNDDDSMYKNTKKRITKLLNVINNTNNTMDSDDFDEVFDDIINSAPQEVKDKNIDDIIKDINSIAAEVIELDLDDDFDLNIMEVNDFDNDEDIEIFDA